MAFSRAPTRSAVAEQGIFQAVSLAIRLVLEGSESQVTLAVRAILDRHYLLHHESRARIGITAKLLDVPSRECDAGPLGSSRCDGSRGLASTLSVMLLIPSPVHRTSSGLPPCGRPELCSALAGAERALCPGRLVAGARGKGEKARRMPARKIYALVIHRVASEGNARTTSDSQVTTRLT